VVEAAERPSDMRRQQRAAVKLWAEAKAAELGTGLWRRLQEVAGLEGVHEAGVVALPNCCAGTGLSAYVTGVVVPMRHAVAPGLVGGDLGCGALAMSTPWRREDLPVSLKMVRYALEDAIPHGKTGSAGGDGQDERNPDFGSWVNGIPIKVQYRFRDELFPGLEALMERHPTIRAGNVAQQLGTIGTGSHFVQVCIDDNSRLWIVVHSGSRRMGARISAYFTRLANAEQKETSRANQGHHVVVINESRDRGLFRGYIDAVRWAEKFAAVNRQLICESVFEVLGSILPQRVEHDGHPSRVESVFNSVSREQLRGEQIWMTRRCAARAEKGELAVIVGTMATPTLIVRGRGCSETYNSCSSDAGKD